jgi:hypothetical protein
MIALWPNSIAAGLVQQIGQKKTLDRAGRGVEMLQFR